MMLPKQRYRPEDRTLVAKVSDAIQLPRHRRISLIARVQHESTIRDPTRRAADSNRRNRLAATLRPICRATFSHRSAISSMAAAAFGSPGASLTYPALATGVSDGHP
jgi:hypothetical protein